PARCPRPQRRRGRRERRRGRPGASAPGRAPPRRRRGLPGRLAPRPAPGEPRTPPPATIRAARVQRSLRVHERKHASWEERATRTSWSSLPARSSTDNTPVSSDGVSTRPCPACTLYEPTGTRTVPTTPLPASETTWRVPAAPLVT